MNDTTSSSSNHRTRSPVRNPSTPQMRAVRKELLLLRAEVERREFIQARAELRHKLAKLGWIKLLVPGLGLGLGGMRGGKRSGRGLTATIADWVLHHPLVSSLASAILGKPLRAKVAAKAKPLLKWGAVGAAAWAGLRAWSQFSHRHDAQHEPGEAGEAS